MVISGDASEDEEDASDTTEPSGDTGLPDDVNLRAAYQDANLRNGHTSGAGSWGVTPGAAAGRAPGPKLTEALGNHVARSRGRAISSTRTCSAGPIA